MAGQRVTALAVTAFLMLIAAHEVLAANEGKLRRYADRVEGEYVVVFERDAARSARSTAGALAAQHRFTLVAVFDVVLGGFGAKMTEAQAVAVSRDPRVAAVHESVRPRLHQVAASWGHDRIDQRFLPLDGAYNSTYTGAGVTAYVLDTGVNAVGDIAPNRVREWVNFTSDAYAGDCRSTSQIWDHGTAVASILGGTTYGIAKDVTLVSVKIHSCDSTPTSLDYLEGVQWVAQDAQTRASLGQYFAVANMSAGMNGPYEPLDLAILDAISAGVTYVVSADNNSLDACGVSPARTGNPDNPAWAGRNPNRLSSITVGASSSGDAYESYSNYGPCVDIFAPGTGTSTTGANGFPRSFGGTSGAAPHVAGVAAMHQQRYGPVSPGMIQTAIIENATTNVLTSLPPNTPNLLLYSGIAKRRACCF